VTNEPAALRYFRRVYGMLVIVPGIFLEDGVVHNPIRGNAGFLEVGLCPRGVDALAEDVASALRKAGFAAQTNDEVMAAKGNKLLSNLGNAMHAITDGRGDATAFMAAVREEAKACMLAASVPFEDEQAFEARTAPHQGTIVRDSGLRARGSTWQSLQRGLSRVESDHLNGEIVRLGRLHGIATPHNEVLQEVAVAMAARRARPGAYTAQDLERMVAVRLSG
jgi:2-dehydropantoate 2-reductase